MFFPLGYDNDVSSLKINQHTFVLKFLKVNYEYPYPLLYGRWYVGTKGLQLRRVQKNCKKYLLSHPHHLFLYTTFITKIHIFSKRFLWSTVDVQDDNTFPLDNQPPYLDYIPLFLGYSLFSHSFGNNKVRWQFLFCSV